MDQYRIETHLHTNHTSQCGWLDADTLAEGYARAGYAAVAVTDHYNRNTFSYLSVDTTAPGDKAGPFLTGFRRMEEECAKRGLKVYKGAELRFDECENDYLLYHYPDELLADPEHGAGSPWYGQLMARPQTIAYLVQVNHWLEHNRVELV